MKEQIKTPEKIQLSNEEIASQPTRCTVQNTGNQDTQEVVEYGHKIEEKAKTVKSEIKGTNMKGRKLRLKAMIWNKRKK